MTRTFFSGVAVAALAGCVLSQCATAEAAWRVTPKLVDLVDDSELIVVARPDEPDGDKSTVPEKRSIFSNRFFIEEVLHGDAHWKGRRIRVDVSRYKVPGTQSGRKSTGVPRALLFLRRAEIRHTPRDLLGRPMKVEQFDFDLVGGGLRCLKLGCGETLVPMDPMTRGFCYAFRSEQADEWDGLLTRLQMTLAARRQLQTALAGPPEVRTWIALRPAGPDEPTTLQFDLTE